MPMRMMQAHSATEQARMGVNMATDKAAAKAREVCCSIQQACVGKAMCGFECT